MTKERIDKLLVKQGHAESRTKAQALVMSGVVLVDEKRVEKPSETFEENQHIRLKGDMPEARYASRAGLKLEKALSEFNIRPYGYVCLDIGASTGGFTDCLLAHGAKKVFAVDSGTNQMIWRLRNDKRVVLMENTNARHLSREAIDEPVDLISVDVSFVSARLVVEPALKFLKRGGSVVLLIKPQFEVGRGDVGKGGIVKDPEKRKRVVEEMTEFLDNIGLRSRGVIESPIRGAAGNIEYLIALEMI
ncbi:MAG: TlyA family RNA methyltransferase [Acidobacteria bacterium]|nr:MAG: TlyA family RNA methyltransferase [Acidobacteriota bacterium]REK02901.1 MAG: TlyA family RNA methyltransferase [Acidobacteriota bacterium]REK13295.1 MAG: TlyA family RNA methyltransferase [Acidobacteriota bacterium]REK41289.1 MAG: TlyA family RNA methyltransferase [Acidobacteriota bacterium]